MAAKKFTDVQLLKFTEEEGSSLGCSKQAECLMNIVLNNHQNAIILTFGEKDQEYTRMPLSSLSCCQLTEKSLALRPNITECNANSLILQFPCTTEASSFRRILRDFQKSQKGGLEGSVFDQRTEESSAVQYFQFYGYLSQQQNMLQDYVRTATYQRAILTNVGDFKDKVILDVGAGSGILSFFAVHAGAKRVYAVEASSMAQHCEALVRANGWCERIIVLEGKIEDISIPEQVDLIISEPMGYMLVNERMLETFLHAKKFLKPAGKMYPSRGDLHVAPFTDESLYLEQNSKASFWCQESFHGVNLSFLRPQALKEYLRQPIVDTWHIGILMARSHCWSVDFLKAQEDDLHRIEIPFKFVLQTTGHVHGLAFWFDVAFVGCRYTGQAVVPPPGSNQGSTSPTEDYWTAAAMQQIPADSTATGNYPMMTNGSSAAYSTLPNPLTQVQAGVTSAGPADGSFAAAAALQQPSVGQNFNFLAAAQAQQAAFSAGGRQGLVGGLGAGQMMAEGRGEQQRGGTTGVGLVTSIPLKMQSNNQTQPQQHMPFSSPRYPQHVLQQQMVSTAGGGRPVSPASHLTSARPSGALSPSSSTNLSLGGGLMNPSSLGVGGQPNPWGAVCLPSNSNG